MIQILLAVLGLAAVLPGPAKGEELVRCNVSPQDQWLPEAAMRTRIIALGYTIDVFKKTTGNCYEIYGRFEGKRVEVYFHPVTGERVKASH